MIIDDLKGRKVIVRSFSAGIFFGEVAALEDNLVHIKSARRIIYAYARQSISISALAAYGVDESRTFRMSPPVEMVVPFSEISIVSDDVAQQFQSIAEAAQS